MSISEESAVPVPSTSSDAKDDSNRPVGATTPSQDKKVRRHRWLLYELVAVVVVVAVVVAAYSVSNGFGKGGGSTSDVLVPARTLDSIPALQFDAIALTLSSTSVVNGTFYHSYPVFVYTMTPTELESLSKTDVVGGYSWTSGLLEGNTIYGLDITIAVGAWYLVFLNPSTVNTTALAFYTALTLSAS